MCEFCATFCMMCSTHLVFLTCPLHQLPHSTATRHALWAVFIGTQETLPARTLCVCCRRTILSIAWWWKRKGTTIMKVTAYFQPFHVTQPPLSSNLISVFPSYLVHKPDTYRIFQTRGVCLRSFHLHTCCTEVSQSLCTRPQGRFLQNTRRRNSQKNNCKEQKMFHLEVHWVTFNYTGHLIMW